MPPATEADYLPARMLNEFVYCPRLFYYEWVEGLFAHSVDTEAGAQRHEKLERKEDALPSPQEVAGEATSARSRSCSLASDQHQMIAKIDLVEVADGRVVPVDYKVGSPAKSDSGEPLAWDADRVQVVVQAIVLRENGYRCDEAVLYYSATKQRVRIAIDDAVIDETLQLAAQARALAEGARIPPPLVDSPKCPRCSLVGICLPDETHSISHDNGNGAAAQRTLFDVDDRPSSMAQSAKQENGSVRRLVPARDDLRPLYLNTQGLYVGKSGGVLKIKDRGKLVQEVRLNEVSQLNLLGNVQITTQAVQSLCEADIPVAYFSQGGWFYGLTQGLGLTNIYLRREQFRFAERPSFCLQLARSLVAGKIRNQRTMLQRNHIEPPSRAIALMRCFAEDAEQADSLEQLLGIEGNAARYYFENFAGMIKASSSADEDLANEHVVDRSDGSPLFQFDFRRRNRRPPRDAVNALLSLAYSILAKDLTIICAAVGFDPFQGFYHQLRHGRPALALDLMEPFRPLIADSAVLSAINTRMITPRDFIAVGPAVALKPEGRKAFFRAYEARMDTLATHPLFGYRVNYRRLLEIQTRLLARVLTGEIDAYPAFTTR